LLDEREVHSYATIPLPIELMNSPHGILQDMRWISFITPSNFALSQPHRGGCNTKPGDRDT
jgi:hypothetical protein